MVVCDAVVGVVGAITGVVVSVGLDAEVGALTVTAKTVPLRLASVGVEVESKSTMTVPVARSTTGALPPEEKTRS